VRHTEKSNRLQRLLRQWILLGIAGLVLLFCACGGGGSAPEIGNVAVDNDQSIPFESKPGTGILPKGGDWTASQMAFRVATDGSLVESFEVSYSGRASNENCDFDYSDVVTLNDLPIADGKFVYDSEELVIEGRFTATQEAEVTVLWFGYYGGACEVFYNGELMEVATLQTTVD
jgi:hypothetical protein